MKLGTVGRVENPDDIDLAPITVDVVGYTIDKQERVFTVQFRAKPKQGMTLDLAGAGVIDAEGNAKLPAGLAMAYMNEHILNLDEWQEFLADDDVYMDTDDIVQVAVMIGKAYTEGAAGRPTMQPSASHTG